MKDECLICGAPLTYFENEKQMECALSHKKRIAKPLVKKVITYVTIATQEEWIALLGFVVPKLQRTR